MAIFRQAAENFRHMGYGRSEFQLCPLIPPRSGF